MDKIIIEGQIQDLDCPNCGREYDEIDYEYQICIKCGFENNSTTNKSFD